MTYRSLLSPFFTLQQNKNLPEKFAAWNTWQRWAVWALWKAMIQPHTQSCSSFLQPVIIKLWGASHMAVCENSLRKLNGAHFIHNWMQIKMPLMRGLKCWQGRLHAVNLRIWIILEYAVPFYSLFLSFATPAKWINQSLPPSWKVKEKESTTGDEEHLSHWQSGDWNCSVQNLKCRDGSSSIGLGTGTAWDLVSYRQRALPYPQWLKRSSGSALELSWEEEATVGKYLPCAWCGVGLWGEYTQPPWCPEEQSVLLRSHEWSKAPGRDFPGFFLSNKWTTRKGFVPFFAQPCGCRLADSFLAPPYTEMPLEGEKMQQLSLS